MRIVLFQLVVRFGSPFLPDPIRFLLIDGGRRLAHWRAA